MSSKKIPAKLFKLKLAGSSMWPFLKDGDMAICRKFNQGQRLWLGNVAAVMVKKNILVHRIIRVKEIDGQIRYKTKGDSRIDDDGWIDAKRVLGEVIRAGNNLRLTSRAAVFYSLFFSGIGKIARIISKIQPGLARNRIIKAG